MLTCLRADRRDETIRALSTLAENDWESLLGAARRHGLSPLFYDALRPAKAHLVLPVGIEERLKRAYLGSAARNMRLYRELSHVLRGLNDEDIPVILLKGAHLAEGVYGNIALRPMGDVDILVKKSNLERAGDVLIGHGYTDVPLGVGVPKPPQHLAPFVKKGEPAIELHFNIIEPPYALRFDMEGIWSRASKVSVLGTQALVLCPEDLLIHLGTHACISHGFNNGIRFLLDISRTISRYEKELRWEQLLSQSNDWGIDRGLYLAFRLSAKYTGITVPEHVMNRLFPSCDDADAVALAEELMLGETTVNPNVAKLFGNQDFSGKLIYLARNVFPSKAEIDPLSTDKLTWPALCKFYYCRITGLVERHWETVWHLFVRDKKLTGLAQIEHKRNQLKDWLVKDT